MAQFLEGGLRFDADADATECLLLLELANDSDIPMFVWRCGRSHRLPYDTQIETANRNTKAESDRDGGDGGDLSGKGDPVVDIPGGSRRCLSLRVPRLSVAPERKVGDLCGMVAVKKRRHRTSLMLLKRTQSSLYAGYEKFYVLRVKWSYMTTTLYVPI